ncbi:MAG: response regulator [Defluviitaleaceae bacterium]|nr:response regulator [Defluviitaleaceae bacterium]MCL2275549.1 response regulator [Defluviitaleaceae bacterium]
MDDKNTILIVDDDTSNLMELSHILRKDYKIYAVKDGVEAIQKARESNPDLILLDVIMPDMDGFAVFNELQKYKETKSIPVIFITGMNDSERRGLSVGAVDYIRKPFDSIVVQMRVSNQIKIINLQRNLKNAVEVAESANKAKTSFLASMSHEIRTPMNAIKGLTEILLANKNLPSDVMERLKNLYTSELMLNALINDILDLTQIESGHITLSLAEYGMASMINDVIQCNIMRIENKPIEFTLEMDENIPAVLYGDVLRIKQILNNLLSNAFKYTEKGFVKLGISCEMVNANIELILRVEDTGFGMDEDQLSVLFTEYTRFTTMRGNTAIEGTGLGLSITHRLIELMNANISVESEPSVGTKFVVRLPQEAVNDAVINRETADSLRAFRYIASDGEAEDMNYLHMPYGKVLVVDDVEINLEVAAGIMEPYGMTIETALSGEEAIRKVETGSTYDIIFMDYMMPDMNGVEVTKYLRASGYTSPIVALTADTVTSSAEVYIQNGFNDFITKPIDINQVNNVLIKYVKK